MENRLERVSGNGKECLRTEGFTEAEIKFPGWKSNNACGNVLTETEWEGERGPHKIRTSLTMEQNAGARYYTTPTEPNDPAKGHFPRTWWQH